QQLVADPLALVLVVHLSATAPAARLSHLPEQLLAGLVEADHRVLRVVGQQVGLDHVLHAPDVVRVRVGRQTPPFDDPRLDVVFCSGGRTVSRLTASTSPSTTSSSASSCRVQWQRPCGGSLQASWTRRCSTSPLILILAGRAGWPRRQRAASRPWVTRRWRTRATVQTLVPSAATICSSACSPPRESSASRRIRAWVSLRAAAVPLETSRSSPARSSTVKVTRYLSMAGVLGLRLRLGQTTKNQDTPFTHQMKVDEPLACRRAGARAPASAAAARGNENQAHQAARPSHRHDLRHLTAHRVTDQHVAP